jgi:hypothetical protein
MFYLTTKIDKNLIYLIIQQGNFFFQTLKNEIQAKRATQ